MTLAQFDNLPLLLRASQVHALGVPRAALEAVEEPVTRADQEVPFGKIGFIRLRSTRAQCTGIGRKLYIRAHVARFINR